MLTLLLALQLATTITAQQIAAGTIPATSLAQTIYVRVVDGGGTPIAKATGTLWTERHNASVKCKTERLEGGPYLVCRLPPSTSGEGVLAIKARGYLDARLPIGDVAIAKQGVVVLHKKREL